MQLYQNAVIIVNLLENFVGGDSTFWDTATDTAKTPTECHDG